ncbi:uncharacterized protein LOC105762199 [Gossypium raimondii]|uniref:uncharacterized protein LOC105762199 n=1 Tax=Gossypium raimondii TaxID=29730 RepID=UPI00063AA1C0|nr:uncharacterized protein LOC105762199 [Gossypium raimondii]
MQEQLDALESQRTMMSQLAQLLADKGKSPTINSGVDQEDPVYPPGFTPTNTQIGSGSNPGDNPTNPVVPDLDDVAEVEKARVDLPKQLEDRCRWLEEKFKVIESADYRCKIDAKDLNLVPDLVLPPKIKMPEFEKYNGTSCPKAHIIMFCRRMTGYIDNDQLLIYCFQDSLIGVAAKWYNQLGRAQICSWKDLAQSFMRQYSHITDMTPDRITLQNMKKKQNEKFRQYTQRLREVATQIQPPLLEKETTMLFINTSKAPFITHMLGSATKSFSDIVMTGEMIKNAVRNGKIDAGENFKRSASRKKEGKVNNVGTYNKGYSKSITIGSPKTVTTSHQGPPRQESNSRSERPQFTPIPITYGELYQNLFNTHVVAHSYIKPMQPPFPKWYDTNTQCKYHAGITGHSIENCTAFKKVVERLIKMGIVKLDDPSGPNVVRNPLPNHSDKGVNAVFEDGSRRIKVDVIEACAAFRTVVQNLMDNKEMEFYKESKESETRKVCALEK